MSRRQSLVIFVLSAFIASIVLSISILITNPNDKSMPTLAALDAVDSPPLQHYAVSEYQPEKEIDNQFIVQFNGDVNDQQDIETLIAGMDADWVDDIPQIQGAVIQFENTLEVEQLETLSSALVIEPNYIVQSLSTYPTNDPMLPYQWAWQKIDIPRLWDETDLESEVTIAVIDSGVCFSHPDLQGRFLENGYDFVDGDDDPSDQMGHGCAISGIIAANIDNGIGIAGIAPNVKILPLRVLDAEGVGTYANVMSAIFYAVDNGADIINLSLGGQNYSQLLEQAIDYAIDHGVKVVAGTGNTGQEGVLYPARYEPVIAVGSYDINGNRSSFSTYGDEVDVLAPGENIVSTRLDGDYASYSGTSMAAPHISALLALSNRSIELIDFDDMMSTPHPTPTENPTADYVQALATDTRPAPTNTPSPFQCSNLTLDAAYISPDFITVEVFNSGYQTALESFTVTYPSIAAYPDLYVAGLYFNGTRFWQGDGTLTSPIYLDETILSSDGVDQWSPVNPIATYNEITYFHLIFESGPNDLGDYWHTNDLSGTQLSFHNPDDPESPCILNVPADLYQLQPTPTPASHQCSDLSMSAEIFAGGNGLNFYFQNLGGDTDLQSIDWHFANSNDPDVYLNYLYYEGDDTWDVLWAGDETSTSPLYMDDEVSSPDGLYYWQYADLRLPQNTIKTLQLILLNVDVPMIDHWTMNDFAGTTFSFYNPADPESPCTLTVTDEVEETPTPTPIGCENYASTYTLGTIQSDLTSDLRRAVECANESVSDDIIDLNGATITYSDAPVAYDAMGHNALQPITSTSIGGTLTIQNGVIERDDTLVCDTIADSRDEFRFFYLENNANLTLSNLTLNNGCAVRSTDSSTSVDTYGGAIYSEGILSLNNSTLSNNVAQSDDTHSGIGGAIYGQSGSINLTLTTLSGNIADTGGAIYAGGGATSSDVDVTINESTITNNQASFAGGVYVATSDLFVANSTFNDNTSSGSSGGIHTEVADEVNIIDSTFYNNTAASQAGAVYIFATQAVITNSTFISNPSSTAESLFILNTPLTLENSILADNVSGILCSSNTSGLVTYVGTNLVEDGSCDASTNSQLTGDPLVDSAGLQDNGGLTQTIALLSDSPAIDAGDDTLVTDISYDQRGEGFPRIVGAHVDLGAYEYQSISATETPTATPPPFSCDNISANFSLYPFLSSSRVYIEIKNSNTRPAYLLETDVLWDKSSIETSYPDISLAAMVLDNEVYWSGADDTSPTNSSDEGTLLYDPDDQTHNIYIPADSEVALWYAQFLNGPTYLSDYVDTTDFAGTTFLFDNPDWRYDCLIEVEPYQTPTSTPSQTPVATSTPTLTPSATPTVCFEGGGIDGDFGSGAVDGGGSSENSFEATPNTINVGDALEVIFIPSGSPEYIDITATIGNEIETLRLRYQVCLYYAYQEYLYTAYGTESDGISNSSLNVQAGDTIVLSYYNEATGETITYNVTVGEASTPTPTFTPSPIPTSTIAPTVTPTVSPDNLICTYTVPASDTYSLIATFESALGTTEADVICLSGGTYVLSTRYDGDSSAGYNGLPTIDSDIAIVGNDSTIERADTASTFRLLNVADTGTLTLYETTLKNGYADGSYGRGGAIYSEGRLNIINSTITENYGRNGSGISPYIGEAYIQGSEFSYNDGEWGGAIQNGNTSTLYDPVELTILDTLFLENSADRGGAIFNRNTLTISNSRFIGNTATEDGIAIYMGTLENQSAIHDNCYYANIGLSQSTTVMYSHYNTVDTYSNWWGSPLGLQTSETYNVNDHNNLLEPNLGCLGAEYVELSVLENTTIDFTLNGATGGEPPYTYSELSVPITGSLSGTYPNYQFTASTGNELLTYTITDSDGYSVTGAVKITIIMPTPTPLIPLLLSSISATIVDETTSQITWTDDNLDESGYRIMQRVTNTWSEIGVVAPNLATYYDSTIDCNTDLTYDYQIQAYRDIDGDEALSDIASVWTGDCPFIQPNGLNPDSITDEEVVLSWNDNSILETNYVLSRKTASQHWAQIASLPTNTTTYVDTAVECDRQYQYQLQGYQSLFDRYTDPITTTLTTGKCIVESPSNISTTVTSGETSINWNPIPAQQTTQIIVERAAQETEAVVSLSLNWQVRATLSGGMSAFTDDDVRCSMIYSYRLQGYNERYDEYSDYSDIIQFETDACPVPVTNTIGLYHEGQWIFREGFEGNAPEITFRFGPQESGWIPLTGDWDGDGVDGIGIYKDGLFALRDISSRGATDYVYRFGNTNIDWQPIVGDWNGDGMDTVGLYHEGQFILTDSNTEPSIDYRFRFGKIESGWKPIAGDWFKYGHDDVGLYKDGKFNLHHNFQNSSSGTSVLFGAGDGWQPIAGDWDADGYTTIGLYKDSSWRLTNDTENRRTVDIGIRFDYFNEGYPLASYRGGDEPLEALALFVDTMDININDVSQPQEVTATIEPTMIPTDVSTVISTTEVEVTPTIVPISGTEVVNETITPTLETTVEPSLTITPTWTPEPSWTPTGTPVLPTATILPRVEPTQPELNPESTDPEATEEVAGG